jgi:hypothetical protein
MWSESVEQCLLLLVFKLSVRILDQVQFADAAVSSSEQVPEYLPDEYPSFAMGVVDRNGCCDFWNFRRICLAAECGAPAVKGFFAFQRGVMVGSRSQLGWPA